MEQGKEEEMYYSQLLLFPYIIFLNYILDTLQAFLPLFVLNLLCEMSVSSPGYSRTTDRVVFSYLLGHFHHRYT